MKPIVIERIEREGRWSWTVHWRYLDDSAAGVICWHTARGILKDLLMWMTP